MWLSLGTLRLIPSTYKQINGVYKVKNERMQKLHHKAIGLLDKFNSWSLTHIPREKNSVADKLSKEGRRGKK